MLFGVSCQKLSSIAPQDQELPPITQPGSNTIPDMAAFRIKLIKDSTNSDETMVLFRHTASLAYRADEDAAYLVGFGQVSLANISGDGKALAINELPYKPGMSIGLDVHTNADGTYFLKMSYINNIPGNVRVIVKDALLNDSTDIAKGNYYFNVTKADSNTFGKKRFRLIIRPRKQPTTQPN